MGDDPETIESIKYMAPRFYASQYRAVTAQDYAVITKNLYSNAESVVAYGGDSLTPPIYGKVYVAVKTKTGSLLNDQSKKDLQTKLRSYSMALRTKYGSEQPLKGAYIAGSLHMTIQIGRASCRERV